MSDLASKVPESVIVAAFAGVMAISPELYGQKLKMLAQHCGVPCNDVFKEYVGDVLRKQPPADFD